MSKVDWVQVEIDYITKPKISYDIIAKRYKVAKSTVVRHAKKNIWKAKRADFQSDRLERARKTSIESVAETDERHLKRLRAAQDIMNHEFMRLTHKALKNGELTPKENRIILDFIGPYTKAIMAERVILGLRTKPVRITDPEDIEEYQIMMGYKEPPADRGRKELDEAIESLDHMIRRKKMLEALRNSYDT